MTITQTSQRENVCRLIQDYADEPYCLRLIQFFGWHPHARFSGLSILHALNVSSEQHYIERAMAQLIDKGLVKSYSEHNVPYYGLTDDESLRRAALSVVSLDWGQWQVVLRHSYGHTWDSLTQPSVLDRAVTNA
jgi:hypothetical protein